MSYVVKGRPITFYMDHRITSPKHQNIHLKLFIVNQKCVVMHISNGVDTRVLLLVPFQNTVLTKKKNSYQQATL